MDNTRLYRIRCCVMHIALVAALLLAVFNSRASAETNVLILEPYSGFDGDGIKTHLQSILQGAGVADANVVVARPAKSWNDSLSGWFHAPYDSFNDIPPIWSNLRGEDGTVWDYVVILEDPEVIETLPGWYAQGVHDVAQEVSKGSGSTVLLMQWPAETSSSTQEYYREVTYRVGRGQGVPVAPAGLARQAAATAAGTSLSEEDTAYIAAASIYSRLWDKSAAESSYSYNDAMAQTAFDTVNANIGVEQYSGPFTKAPSGVQTIKDNRKRELLAKQLIQFNNGYNPAEGEAGSLTHRITREGLIIRETNLGHYDLNFYYGIPGTDIVKDKDSELMLPNSFDRHNDASFDSLQSFQRGVAYEYSEGKSLARYWLKGDEWYRHHPLDLLFAQTAHYPLDAQAEFRNSGTPFHSLSAAYMFTIMTGRCPVPLYDDGSIQYIGDRIGYETAWRLSTLHGRAPGFKTWPTDRLRKTVDSQDPVTLQVAFALQPEENVTVSVSFSSAFASASPQTLTFTPQNYNRPQSVTVSVAPDSPPSEVFDVIFTTESNDVVYDELNQSWAYQVNHLPVVADMTVSAYADETNEIELNGTDADGETLDYIITRPPSRGTLVFHDSFALYTPIPGYVGADSFDFKAKNFSVLSEEATVTINVEPTPGYGRRNLLLNGRAEYGAEPGLYWVVRNGVWKYVKQSYNPVKDRFSNTPFEGFHIFSPIKQENGEIAELYQDVDVSRYRAAIDRGDQAFELSSYARIPSDQASFVVSYFDASGTVLSEFDSLALANGPNWELFTQQLFAPAATTRIRVLLRATDSSRKGDNSGRFDQVSLVALQPVGVSQPTAYAGADQLIYDVDDSGSETIYLNGGSSYDDGTITSYVWTESGGQIATGATAEVDKGLGVHTFTLTVTDNDGNTATDSVVVTIVRPELPPTVNAGPEQLNVSLSTESVGVAPISVGLLHQWDAAKDSDGNNTWSSSDGSASRAWTFTGGGQTQEIVSDPRFNALSRAYAFPAAEATSSHFQGKWTGQDTFEFMIDVDGADGLVLDIGRASLEIRVISGILRAKVANATVYYLLPNDLGGWMHIVLVWDTSDATLKLYVDSKLQDSARWTTGTWGGNKSTSMLGNDFVGKMALMRIYTNHALSPDDVRANFNSLSMVPRAIVNLNGSVSDPQNPTPTATWTVASTQPAGLTVDFADSFSPATTATFTAAGTYTLRLTTGNGPDAVHDDLVVKVTGTPGSGFTNWISTFNIGDQTGLDDDPDYDDNSNMMEFAFGTAPALPDVGPMVIDGSCHGSPVAMPEPTDGVFHLYFLRRADHGQSGSLTYTPCFSDDLSAFYESHAGLLVVATSSVNPDYEVVKVPFPATLPSGKPANFGCVSIEPVPEP